MAWAAPSSFQKSNRASLSRPAAVGICIYVGSLPFATASSIKDFSKAAIAGRYSPEPTSASEPFIG